MSETTLDTTSFGVSQMARLAANIIEEHELADVVLTVMHRNIGLVVSSADGRPEVERMEDVARVAAFLNIRPPMLNTEINMWRATGSRLGIEWSVSTRAGV